ncbi:MAG TPA: histidine kinase [Spirochaetia bacterium]|nr:histidine kinase [Spirochaetia bacterium]
MSRDSLRVRLLLYLSISMVIMMFSLGFILLNSLNLQNLAYLRFQEEHYFQELQTNLGALQEPLEKYLTDRSSSALTRLLFLIETIHEKVPPARPISSDQTFLMKREIYFLIDAYLSQVNQIIELKRGRKVVEYIDSYDELSKLYRHISAEIDNVSLRGFRVQLEEYRSFLGLFRRIQYQNLLLVVVATAFAYFLLLRLVNNITKPMLQLSYMARQLSNGKFDIPDLHISSITEVNQVSSAFNHMKNSIAHYVSELKKQKEMEQQIMTERVRNLRMEQLLKRMELYTMQAQMNPHFLFNTLNTGVQLAIVEEADRTADFMENLAALFRHNIRGKKFFVPLGHEIEGLRSYYAILQIRFPKTLRLILDIEESLLEGFTCPAMILQPLVENSVVHAFSHADKTGTITVKVRLEKPVLVISVSDDGIGMPESLIRELLAPHTHDYPLGPKVMGLENVIQRCYFFYPDQKDVINIESAPGKGTAITIRIHTEVEPCIEL